MEEQTINSPSPKRHPLFFGEYELSIDDKSRLTVPADVRKSIDQRRHGSGFFVTVGVNRKPWIYPEWYYESLVDQDATEMSPEEDLLAADQLNFALAKRVPIDAQFRIPLPDRLLRRTGIQREITLAAVRDHLEIWNRADWEARFAELIEHPSEIASRAKQLRRTSEQPATRPGNHSANDSRSNA